MLWFMTGTPGSGKSYSMATQIEKILKRGANVISTVDINLDILTKNGRIKIGNFLYIPIFELNVETLYRYAANNHEKGIEHQTYIFIDECQMIFNSREYSSNTDRKPWLRFFNIHRHIGYDCYLITQNDMFVDKQIRAMVEYEIHHRKINNLLWFLPMTVFSVVEIWYGHTKKPKIRSQFVRYKSRVGKLYDSYTMFDEFAKQYADEPDGREEESLAEIEADADGASAGAFSGRRRAGSGGYFKM
ncbi:MAG: zonular occludens toxin domain-containing protein, partial [Defluviitaleaceae bacterium]|nr:zonular occludens toxin domain-containing protein [Defluviitaleaceae bacterium]